MYWRTEIGVEKSALRNRNMPEYILRDRRHNLVEISLAKRFYHFNIKLIRLTP